MLSRPASRVAHAPNPFVVSSSALRSATPTHTISAPSRPQHRRSSSKTSHPPGSPPPARGSSQAGSTTSSEAQSQDKRRQRAATADDTTQTSTYHKTSKDVTRNGSFARSDVFANVPRVEPTDQLNLDNVKLSSLFALHRPIPINPAVAYPPTTSNKTFSAIFSPPKKSKISDEVYTMATHPAPQSAYANEDADGLHFSVLQSSDSNAASDDAIYLDNPPSLESLARQYRPFQVPPAPVPLGDSSQPADQDARPKSSRTEKDTRRMKRSTDSEIANFFTAELPTRLQHVQTSRQSFLNRMEERGMANIHALAVRETHITDALRQQEDDTPELAELENAMLLISVKRQRRLKMKKHKYKKLMRRTRNLRRREGRL